MVEFNDNSRINGDLIPVEFDIIIIIKQGQQRIGWSREIEQMTNELLSSLYYI